MTKTAALILAAGKGTRMHSDKPKVLQTILQTPMLGYVIKALQPFYASHIWTVVGHQADMIKKMFDDSITKFIWQEEQRGTGHALQVALPTLLQNGYDSVLVVNGDVPLIDEELLEAFIKKSENASLSFATLNIENAGSYGRVVRKDGKVQAIVEAKDYDVKVHGIESGEVNSGLYYINLSVAKEFLPKITCANNSSEYYITDLVGLLVEANIEVLGIKCGNNANLLGVNSPLELVSSEDNLRRQIVQKALESGVIIHNKDLVSLGPNVTVEPGAEIFGPCEIYGKSYVECGASIHSHCVIIESHIAKGAKILSFSHIESAKLSNDVQVGPYARLRPGAELCEQCKVGNFVEIKKSTLEKGAKVSHLSYIGDASVGENANIGAGTITCNYDGKNKFKTQIGKKAFVGSNTALVAPVVVGDGAIVGAGSVITKDVPDNQLGISRQKQKNLPLRKKD